MLGSIAGLVVLGGLFAAVGATRLWRERRLRAGGAAVQGVVEAQRSTVTASGSTSGLTQHPVVAFRTREGRLVRATSPVGTNESSIVPGRRVSVYYDPGDPQKISISGHGTWVYRLFLAIGVLLLLCVLTYVAVPNRDELLDKLPFGIPLLLGVVFGAIGFFGVRRTWLIKHRGGVTDGVVVGASRSTTRNGLTLHHPVVRFQAPDGSVVDAPSIRGRMARPPQPGTRVRVHYDLADPDRVLLSHDGTPAIFWLFGIIGVVVLLGGLAVLVGVLAG